MVLNGYRGSWNGCKVVANNVQRLQNVCELVVEWLPVVGGYEVVATGSINCEVVAKGCAAINDPCDCNGADMVLVARWLRSSSRMILGSKEEGRREGGLGSSTIPRNPRINSDAAIHDR